jgi:hypothetical protein
MRKGRRLLTGLLLGASLAGPITPAFALALISEEEARRPAGAAAELELRGITRGPTIKVVSPAAATTSPTALKIVFEPHGASTINVATVKVTYLRSPAVDLTQRLQPFISAGGIALDDATIPAGRHAVRIDVMDAQGRQSSSIVKFTVGK